MTEWPRIAKVFLDVKPGEEFSEARTRAAAQGCEFLCFNDRLHAVAPTAIAFDEAPECYVWFLRGDFERAHEHYDRRRNAMPAAH